MFANEYETEPEVSLVMNLLDSDFNLLQSYVNVNYGRQTR